MPDNAREKQTFQSGRGLIRGAFSDRRGTSMNRFADRSEAGRALADVLVNKDYTDPVILALPRGGVPVATEVARALKAPLDLVMVRKIGVPGQPELAAAAVVNGDDPQLVINQEIARMSGLSHDDIDRLAETQLQEIRRWRGIYLKGRDQISVKGRTAIIVDDGIATGATMRASLKAVRQRGPARLVLAVPVAPGDTISEMRGEVDELICLRTPGFFGGVGAHYVNFSQTTDDEVVRLLNEAQQITPGDHGTDRV